MNKSIQKIQILPDSKTNIISVYQDSILIAHLPNNRFEIKRNSKPLIVKYTKNQDTFQLIQKPFISNWYWWNIYFNYGLGMIIDDKSEKKYSFLKQSYISNISLVKEKKGNLKWSIPFEYNLIQSKNGVTYINFLFFVLGSGIEYYYKDNKYINYDLSTSIYIGKDKSNSNQNTKRSIVEIYMINSIRHNHIYNNFEINYGLSNYNNSQNNYLGLSMGATNYFTKSMAFQLCYEPQIIELNQINLVYYSSIRLRLLFKFKLNNF